MKLKIAMLLVVLMAFSVSWASEELEKTPSPVRLSDDVLKSSDLDLQPDATVWRWWQPWKLWKWDSQRMLTRHDSYLEFEGNFNTSARSIGEDSGSRRFSDNESNVNKVKVPVQQELVTLLFDSMLGHVVESWNVIVPKREECLNFSEKEMFSKRTKKNKSLKSKRSTFYKDVQMETVIVQPEPSSVWYPCVEERAIIQFKSGNKYEGGLYMKRMHGQGRFQWTDGTVYIGEFNDNAISGRGTIYWKDDTWYTGEFLRNMRHGRGLFVDSRRQRSYIGDWYCGSKHGQGVIYYSKTFDNSYDGQWVHNVREGPGTREYDPASGYQGEWDYYTREKKGMMIWSNHDFYKGSWRNGKMSGYGTYIWENYYNDTMSQPATNSFRGNWRNGERHGFGELNLGHWMGSRYKGEFKNNRKHGSGTLIHNNGLIIEDAKLFEADNLSSSSAERQSAPNNKINYLEIDNDSTVCMTDHIKWVLKNINFENDENMTQILREYFKNNMDLYDQRTQDVYANISSKGQNIDLKEWADFEDFSMKNSMRCYESSLKNIYFTYSTVCNDEEIHFTPIMIKLYLWQFYYDCNIHQKGLTLVDIDRIFQDNPHWLTESLHDPFARVYYWQFLHSLIAVASRLYCEKHLPVAKPDTVVATAFIKFMENDVLPNTGKRKSSLVNGYGRCLPLKAMYKLYRNIGEPHTIRQFLNASRLSPLRPDQLQQRHVESSEEQPLRQDEPRQQHNVETSEEQPLRSDQRQQRHIEASEEDMLIGKNTYLLGGKLLYIADETFKTQNKKVGNEDFDEIKIERNGLKLFNFQNIPSKTIIGIFANIFPHLVDNGKITNMDIEIVFFEFFEAFIACTKECIRLYDTEIRQKVFSEPEFPTR